MSMSEWQKYKLGEVYSFSSGLSKSSDQFGYGFDFLTFKDVFNNYFLPDKLTALVNSTEKERQTCSIKRGDVFLTRTSETDDELGMSSVSLKDYPNATFNGFTKRLRPIGNVEIYPEFVAYYFRSPRFRANIVGMSSITTRASLNNSMLAELPLLLPNYEEQVRIATILKSLDDKIELLHRENKTLEAMAETLFRQWFIEEAKEDWEEISLTKVANFLNGLACQKYPPKNEIEKLPVLKIRELSNGIGDDSDWATTDIASEYIIHAGDVIFAWSASLMVKIWDGEDCILNQHLFKVTSYKYPKWFYYLWCKHHLNEFIAIAQSHATTMGHIKRSDLESAIVLIPSNKELMMMNEQMDGMLRKIENNNRQLQTLIKVRNVLLPKLMNREISIYG